MEDEQAAITIEDEDPLSHVGEDADAPEDVGRPADDDGASEEGSS